MMRRFWKSVSIEKKPDGQLQRAASVPRQLTRLL